MNQWMIFVGRYPAFPGLFATIYHRTFRDARQMYALSGENDWVAFS